MASSGLAYPERFYAAASYVGFGESPPSAGGAISRFENDVALLLYGLYQQATVGPCNVAKPRAWNPVEHSKWTSWHGLGNMASTEAMRLFVKILEEEDPAWYSKVPEFTVEPITDVEMHPELESLMEPAVRNGNAIPEPKTISAEAGSIVETQDKDIVIEGLGSVGVYDHWVSPTVYGQRPKPRYQHGSATIQDKMYIFGGNYNGCYLNDLQVLDFSSMTWSEVESRSSTGQEELLTSVPVAPCAGHSLVERANRIFSIGGHTKDLSASIIVKEFDTHTCTWCNLKNYGRQPSLRVAQSATVFGATVVIFGGEDANRSPLNDLHILDLETMAWVDFDDM